MALRTARRLVVRGRPPGRAAGRTWRNPGPRRVGQVGVVESRMHRAVPLAQVSALSRQTSTFQTPSNKLGSAQRRPCPTRVQRRLPSAEAQNRL